MKLLKSVAIVIIAFYFQNCSHGERNQPSDALWNIVSKQCLPKGEYINQKVNPCTYVDVTKGEEEGHVIFKDRVGVLQYLLMPTADISGIESPLLLKDKTSNYMYLSWQARLYMERKMRDKLNPEHVSLAINSKFGRTQNHLHVHISCVKPDIKKQMDDHAAKIEKAWKPLDFTINGHHYLAKKVTETELAELNVFKDLSQTIESGAQSMAEYGVGMVVVPDKGTPEGYALILLASRRDKETGSRGSVEEIQDHDCRIIFPL